MALRIRWRGEGETGGREDGFHLSNRREEEARFVRDLSDLSSEDAAFFREKGYLPQSPEARRKINELARRLNVELAPHRATLDEDFRHWRGELEKLFARDHDAVGRVLKHHLILEHYVTRYLRTVAEDLGLPRPSLGKLTFAEKVELIPVNDALIAYYIPGISEVNDARNKLGHDISARLSLESFPRCLDVLGLIHPYINNTYSDPVVVTEDFTRLVCSSLPVNAKIKRIMREAHERASAVV